MTFNTRTKVTLLLSLLILIGAGIFVWQKPDLFQFRAEEKQQLTTDNKNKEIVGGLNGELLTLNTQYTKDAKAPAAQKQKILNNLIVTADERKKLLLGLIEKNPADFLQVIFPQEQRKKIPQEVQKYLEEEMSLEGELSVSHADDFENQKAEYFYALKTADDQEFSLSLAIGVLRPQLLSGAKVKIRGFKLEKWVAVDLQQENAKKENLQIISQPNIQSIGEKKIAVILFNFEDSQEQPFTPEVIRRTTFTHPTFSINKAYQTSSYNKISLSGDVYGWYTLPITHGSDCRYLDWAREADNKAIENGYISHHYDKIIYVSSFRCPGPGGIGEMGGRRAWVFGNNYSMGLVSHELGHTFGFDHARGLNCPSIDNYPPHYNFRGCDIIEYADSFDVMGDSDIFDNLISNAALGNVAENLNLFLFKNSNMGQLGWLGPENVLAVSDPGEYHLEPIETSLYNASTSKPSIKALHIMKNAPNPQMEDRYVLEYRQGNGVIIRHGSEEPYDPTIIIDTHPDPNEDIFHMYDNAPLLAGQTFLNAATGVKITALSTTTQFANVKIEFIQPSCARAKHAAGIYPEMKAGSPGESLGYFFSIENKDSMLCEPTRFFLSFSSPKDNPVFNGKFEKISVKLGPGEVKVIKVIITSPLKIIDGTYVPQISIRRLNSQSTITLEPKYIIKDSVCKLTVNTDKNEYSEGEQFVATAQLLCNKTPLANQKIVFSLYEIHMFSGTEWVGGVLATNDTETNSNGIASWQGGTGPEGYLRIIVHSPLGSVSTRTFRVNPSPHP